MVLRLIPTPPAVVTYDELRRREHDLLLRQADVLARVDGLPATVLEQSRDAVFHIDHPFLLALIGPFGVGKSSLVNAMLGEDLLQTGPIPTTDHVTILRYGESTERLSNQDGTETVFHPSPLLKTISMVDTPGLGSVFTQHSERTDAFLHRSDWVMLVMLATQALSAGNLAYLEELKKYGKRVLAVVNQVDLLDADQRETVQSFVHDQVVQHLGTEPEVFLVSSRQALQAQASDPPDEVLWEESGLAELQNYVLGSLDDEARLRQKLQTPLQVSRRALSEAQDVIQQQQQALDVHRTVQANITAQINAGADQQREHVNQAVEQSAALFAESAQRGEDAIREMFQPTRAVRLAIGGLFELVGVSGLARRMGAATRMETIFTEQAVYEPLRDLTSTFNELGPRLEGRDLQDIDDLVVYTKDALDDLPQELRGKVIGEISTPVSYNREPLRKGRSTLEGVSGEARQVELKRIDRQIRNALLQLAGWLVAVIIAVILLSLLPINWDNALLPLLMVFGALALMFLGVALFSYRGHVLAREFANRMVDLSQRYQVALGDAADEQINYGVQLREDTVAPFTRMITAQANLLSELTADLRKNEDEMNTVAQLIKSAWKQENA